MSTSSGDSHDLKSRGLNSLRGELASAGRPQVISYHYATDAVMFQKCGKNLFIGLHQCLYHLASWVLSEKEFFLFFIDNAKCFT